MAYTVHIFLPFFNIEEVHFIKANKEVVWLGKTPRSR